MKLFDGLMAALVISAFGVACISLDQTKSPSSDSSNFETNSPISSDARFRIDQNRRRFTILIFGDFGTGIGKGDDAQVRVAEAMTRICSERNCDFALGLGDNIYPSGVSSPQDPLLKLKFESPYKGLLIPFYMSLGNHDYSGNVDAQIAYQSDRWHLPSRYYQVPDLPTWLRIFALDTNRLTSHQLDQAREVMCPPIEGEGWKILFGHHPIISNGGHFDSEEMKQKVVPILEDCHVPLFLAGHDHHMESLTTPTYEEVIAGTAGDHSSVEMNVEREDAIQNFAASELGFVLLVIDRKTAVIQFINEKTEILFEKTLDSSRRKNHHSFDSLLTG